MRNVTRDTASGNDDLALRQRLHQSDVTEIQLRLRDSTIAIAWDCVYAGCSAHKATCLHISCSFDQSSYRAHFDSAHVKNPVWQCYKRACMCALAMLISTLTARTVS